LVGVDRITNHTLSFKLNIVQLTVHIGQVKSVHVDKEGPVLYYNEM
jgi:hypothetical protein